MRRRCRRNCFGILLTLALLGPASGLAKPAEPLPIELSLPTAEPSGIPVNDRIWLWFYPTKVSGAERSPAVVLLHQLGDADMLFTGQFARYLARQGIASAIMTLPYHLLRRPPGERSGARFWDPKVNRIIQAAKQSASDTRTVVTWLSQQPSVDPHRLGVVGISLGAIVAHVAMGEDERLRAGVAILGGGDLVDLHRSSLLYKMGQRHAARILTPAEAERLRQVDPITYAGRNRPRHVLMIEAARDLLIPPRDARALWNALGRPPILWVDTNHFGLTLMPRAVIRTAAAYLWSVWNGDPLPPSALPPIPAATLKLGLLLGLDSRVTPALQWQAWTIATRRDHLSLLHLDLGMSGRGPFAGLAVTLNPFIDLGVAHRFSGRALRPYVSLHVVF